MGSMADRAIKEQKHFKDLKNERGQPNNYLLSHKFLSQWRYYTDNGHIDDRFLMQLLEQEQNQITDDYVKMK
jgi:hypothetical protein